MTTLARLLGELVIIPLSVVLYICSLIVCWRLATLIESRFYYTYLVEDREFTHEAAARDYISSFNDDVPRRPIRRTRFHWRDAP